jgi:hypothetical protein
MARPDSAASARLGAHHAAGQYTNTGSWAIALVLRREGWPAGNTFDKSNPQYIFQQIWNVPEFQLRVADKVRSMFFDGGPMTPAAADRDDQ